MSSYSLILIFNFFPLWTKFGCISESLCLSVRPSICADSCPASNSYGEILHFLLICITAILESVLWIPTQQNILREKIIFKLSSQRQFGIISSSFGFVLYSNKNWNVQVCLQNDVKLVVLFTWKYEAELHKKVMMYSKERAFDAFLKLVFITHIFHWSISSSSVMKALNANSLILKNDLN